MSSQGQLGVSKQIWRRGTCLCLSVPTTFQSLATLKLETGDPPVTPPLGNARQKPFPNAPQSRYLELINKGTQASIYTKRQHVYTYLNVYN